MRFVKCAKCGWAWLHETTPLRCACPKCNFSIYFQSPTMKWPRFVVDTTPAEVMGMKPADRADLAYMYIDSWNGHLTVGIVIYADDGWHARVRLYNPIKFQLTVAALAAAIADAGVSIDSSGMYPLNDALKDHFRGLIDQPECA